MTRFDQAALVLLTMWEREGAHAPPCSFVWSIDTDLVWFCACSDEGECPWKWIAARRLFAASV